MTYFEGKVVIVTGSSTGIGRATAELFAKRGAKVTITGRSAESLEITRQLCEKAAGGNADKVLSIIGDVTKEEDTKRIIAETINKFGQLDVLVNNAGAATKPGLQDSHYSQPLEVFDYVMNLNARSLIALDQEAIPHLKKTKGNIVNVSSILGFRAYPSMAYYCMAKAANDQLNRILAIDLAKEGIRVNNINPGPVRTEFLNRNGEPEAARDWVEDNIIKPNCPMARSATSEEMATVIAFLANNDEARFVTGQMLVADGGMSISSPPLPTNAS
uniref:Uncharacterized protein n=1 Tax=Plectus sambesii TaxID=2011161 RepID=A0A914VZM1_9BILA